MNEYGYIDRALPIIEQIEALDDAPTSQLEGERIALMFDGDFWLFQALDEKPGLFDPAYTDRDWHRRLRRARNGCDAFFDLLNAKPDDPVRVLAEMRRGCEYHPLDEGGVDALIAYKDAIEDAYAALLDRARALERKSAAWEAVHTAARNNTRGSLSAADVVAVVWQEVTKLDEARLIEGASS